MPEGATSKRENQCTHIQLPKNQQTSGGTDSGQRVTTQHGDNRKRSLSASHTHETQPATKTGQTGTTQHGDSKKRSLSASHTHETQPASHTTQPAYNQQSLPVVKGPTLNPAETKKEKQTRRRIPPPTPDHEHQSSVSPSDRSKQQQTGTQQEGLDGDSYVPENNIGAQQVVQHPGSDRSGDLSQQSQPTTQTHIPSSPCAAEHPGLAESDTEKMHRGQSGNRYQVSTHSTGETPRKPPGSVDASIRGLNTQQDQPSEQEKYPVQEQGPGGDTHPLQQTHTSEEDMNVDRQEIGKEQKDKHVFGQCGKPGLDMGRGKRLQETVALFGRGGFGKDRQSRMKEEMPVINVNDDTKSYKAKLDITLENKTVNDHDQPHSIHSMETRSKMANQQQQTASQWADTDEWTKDDLNTKMSLLNISEKSKDVDSKAESRNNSQENSKEEKALLSAAAAKQNDETTATKTAVPAKARTGQVRFQCNKRLFIIVSIFISVLSKVSM